MTTPPEQIEAALAAFALASGLGIFPNDEKDEEWREDLVNGMRAAIDTMRPFIRTEALEEAAVVCDEHAARYEADMQIGDDDGTLECVAAALRGRAAAIRALKDKP